ncbi:oxidoreductase [Paraburkholderia phytofirmans OLGA172]|uniref:Oxidoreductase n=1 Tax=Paraburkholderia phytofirmans OLGA172 TaxID=1417228 RepID=A0A160FQ41_9BURK|nr:FAD-binding protein [Paraburkholderia phytofirmans]ANB74990.1 oxidoreductase [Paraburkholderia phytofirmans OLGA172]
MSASTSGTVPAGTASYSSAHFSRQTRDLELKADVLVIGGGLAGAWAALGAARSGASVVLVDKGYCGTSGVTASGGPGHWWVPPDPAVRRAAIEKRSAAAEGLADERWMERVIDLTWRTLPTLAGHYDFPVDAQGVTQYRGLRGPEYMRAMRSLVQQAGVRILDQSPALELLADPSGGVAGARGVRRQEGDSWCVKSGAVVLATGGCAFLSRLLGSDTNTGDGYLMGVEAGAELSGMEFSNYYTVAPANSTMTRSMAYAFANYHDAGGRLLPIGAGPDSTRALAKALLEGPVFCRLSRMPNDIREMLPRVSPNVSLAFRRQGIDPFVDAFEVTLRGEGTVRGVGGLRVTDDECRTTVPGLYAAGDAASRENVAGAISGGGAQNSAWALSSGLWAGQGAARKALERRQRDAVLRPLGEAALRPSTQSAVGIDDAIRIVQGEMLPLDKNLFRDGPTLTSSLQTLDALWTEARSLSGTNVRDVVRARESAALVATGRWCYAAALARTESRGMHQRSDAPAQDPHLAVRIAAGGLERVWTRIPHHPLTSVLKEHL